MVLLIIIIISLIIQAITVYSALKLVRKTKFNSAWILFSAAIILISYQLVTELIKIYNDKPTSYKAFSLWSTVILSLCVAFGILYVRKMLNYIESINKQRQLTERRLLNTIIYTEEKERQRLSKDLHDGLGPLLSSAKMSISVLATVEKDPQTSEMINNTAYVIDEAIKEVKDISNNISPTILQNFGISRALNNFVTKRSLPVDIKLNFSSNFKDSRFNGNTEIVFYRVGCELINNAMKHSNATMINVNLEHWSHHLQLTVSDNGVGMNSDIIEQSVSGMGLKNIRSRINSLNGEVLFMPQSKGSKIRVTVNV